MWDLSGPGIEPLSPALAGGFLTTGPPGKSGIQVLETGLSSNPSALQCVEIIWIMIFFSINLRMYACMHAAPGLSCGMWNLRCSMRTLSCSMHVGSSSLTRDRTLAPCIGSAKSYPLDHQGSPWIVI